MQRRAIPAAPTTPTPRPSTRRAGSPGERTTMAWILLISAGLLETGFAVSLDQSEGFTAVDHLRMPLQGGRLDVCHQDAAGMPRREGRFEAVRQAYASRARCVAAAQFSIVPTSIRGRERIGTK